MQITSQEIGSSDNGSTHYWPPGLLDALCIGGHIQQRFGSLCGLKFFALNKCYEEYLQASLCLMLQLC